MGFFIKSLLIILGVYLLGKMIIKSVLSWFLGDTVQKMNEQLRKQQDEIARQKKKTQGHVTINYNPTASKNFQKDDGDYVEFEEVK